MIGYAPINQFKGGVRMRTINKIIRRKIVEITICLAIIICSAGLWGFWQNENIAYAKTYDTTSYAYVNVSQYQNYEMVPMKDQEALKYLYPMKVTLEKNIISETHYILAMRVAKSSNMDLSSIKLSIDNQVYFLQDRFYKEDNTYIYYLIDEGGLKEPTKEYYLNIWLDENASKTHQKQMFRYDFINLELNEELAML